jgi:hypothetical protein
MRNEDTDSLKSIALAYYLTAPVWGAFVPRERRQNHFCQQNYASARALYEIDNFRGFASSQNRYEWINYNAYDRHRTFEVRLHHGTLNEEEVCNWIRAHAVFIDWAANMGWVGVRQKLLALDVSRKLYFLRELWEEAGCADLGPYYSGKILTLAETVVN